MKKAPYPRVLKKTALTTIPEERDSYVGELEDDPKSDEKLLEGLLSGP